MKIVYDIGIKDREYPAWKDGKSVKEYVAWCGMLYRCTQKWWDKFPTYVGTTCSENFKSYSYFYKWCQSQAGFGEVDESGRAWHLDKDLLIKGNKLYSEDTCVFVPQRLNHLLLKSNATRGKHLLGVTRCTRTKSLRVRCSVDGKERHLGCFRNQEDAFQAYKNFKEGYIKEVAEQYKTRVDARVYNALIGYEVNEND